MKIKKAHAHQFDKKESEGWLYVECILESELITRIYDIRMPNLEVAEGIAKALNGISK